MTALGSYTLGTEPLEGYLASDSGSYALTGLETSRAVSFSALYAAYTLAGQVVSAAQTRVAATGAYALVGQGAVSSQTRVAGAASYMLTGAAVPSSQVRVSDFGVFSVAGQTADFVGPYRVAVQPGAWALAAYTLGTDPVELYLPSGSATFTLQGEDVSSRYAPVAATGVYSLVGVPAGRGYDLPALPTSFSLDGEPAAFAFGGTAGTGPFDFVGMDAGSIVFTPAETGAFSLLTEPVDLKPEYPGWASAAGAILPLAGPGGAQPYAVIGADIPVLRTGTYGAVMLYGVNGELVAPIYVRLYRPDGSTRTGSAYIGRVQVPTQRGLMLSGRYAGYVFSPHDLVMPGVYQARLVDAQGGVTAPLDFVVE